MDADPVWAGADELVGKLQDARWQKQRDLIAEYGRECYNIGASRLMERLAAEAGVDQTAPPDGYCYHEGSPCPGGVRRPVTQVDGSPEA